MQISKFLVLAAVFAAVAAEICQICSHNGPIPISLTISDELDKILIAAEPPSPSDASSPGSPDPDSESDDESDAEENVTPATDEVYDKCREKGCLLEWSMHHTDGDVGPYYVPRRMTAQSPFNTWQQLNMWDWNEFPHASWTKGYQDLDSEQWGIHVALEGLGVSRYTEFNKERGPNYIYSIVHEDILADDDLDDQKYQVDGKWYRATGADYVMSINTQDGVMIGMNRKGPADTAKDREPPLKPEEMPKLSQFSDVGWITWKKAAQQHENDIKKLRYFISISIENPQTRSVCRRIIHDNNLVLGRWPGHFFEGGTNEFNAILGTPNMQGFGYMLVQHKADLGQMFISRIQLFKCENDNLCIVAHVSQPVADPVDDPMDTSGEVNRRDEGSNVVRTHKIFAKL